MNSRWVLHDEHPQVPRMMELINVPRVIAQILLNRGVSTFDDARYFLKPTLDDLHSPFLMEDMDLAVERIADAIERQEHIMVFGDYDVDGNDGKGAVQTSSPFSPTTASPASLKMLTFMPRPRDCSSPR